MAKIAPEPWMFALTDERMAMKTVYPSTNTVCRGINTTFTLIIQTDRPEQMVQTQVRHHSHRMWGLIRVYNVCHSDSKMDAILILEVMVSQYLLSFQHLSESRFWHGALHRSKFANFCHDLMQNCLS